MTAKEEKPLSRKHRAFADKYAILMNGTRAYMEVYKDASYETAMVNSSKLLRNAKIKAYLDEIFKESHVSAEEALKLQGDIARGDIADLMELTTMGGTIDLKTAKERGLTRLIKKVKQKTTIHIAKKESDEDREVHELELELYPADTAQERILKINGMYKDSIEHTGKIEVVVKYADGSHSNDT